MNTDKIQLWSQTPAYLRTRKTIRRKYLDNRVRRAIEARTQSMRLMEMVAYCGGGDDDWVAHVESLVWRVTATLDLEVNVVLRQMRKEGFLV